MVVNVLAKHGTRVRFPSPAPMLGIFSKITRKNLITEKVRNSEAGLYFYLVFPIAFAFLLTFVGARILNTLYPDLFIPFGSSGFRVHHFAYGFFILAISICSISASSSRPISLIGGIGTLFVTVTTFAFVNNSGGNTC